MHAEDYSLIEHENDWQTVCRQRMVTPRAQIEAQTQVSRRAFVAVATLMAASPAYASTLDPAFVQETRILSATINDYMTLVCRSSEAH